MSYAYNKHFEWIESAHKVKCSPLGKEVANILGYVGGGIYNAPFDTKKVNWDDQYVIEVNWNASMANWDGRALTALVIECHRRMVRVSISPNMRSLKLQFWQRTTSDRSEGMSQCLPDIEEMIAMRDAEWGVTK